MKAATEKQEGRYRWLTVTLWTIARVWVGWQFLTAGLAKFGSPVWTGQHAGVALRGFLDFATSPQMTSGPHPSVLGPYVWLTDHLFLPHATMLSYLVTMGELLVGAGLILGLFTRLAALGGALLNINYMLAGSAGLNAPMLPIELGIVLVGTNAGLIGLDAVIVPYFRAWLGRFDHRQIFQRADGLVSVNRS